MLERSNTQISPTQLHRLPGETEFEHKLRLCKLKLQGDIDSSWQEIVYALGVDIHPDHLRKTAYGIVEYDRHINSTEGVARRCLHISDLHIPYQKPVGTFSKYFGRVDDLLLGGDICDCQAISKFTKLYRESPMLEIISARDYLIDLIKNIKPKRVISIYGNHDLRFQEYFAKNLDNDLVSLMPSTPLELIFIDGFNHYDKFSGVKSYYQPLCEVFKDIEICYVDNWWAKVGRTLFCHPLAYKSGILKTTEQAVDFFRNEDCDFTSIIMAHTHQVGFSKKGKTLLYESGCCCESDKLKYSNGRLVKSQKEGYIYFCQDNNGDIIYPKVEQVVLN